MTRVCRLLAVPRPREQCGEVPCLSSAQACCSPCSCRRPDRRPRHAVPGRCTHHCPDAARGSALIADPPYGVGFNFLKYRRSRHPLQAGIPAARWSANVLGDDQPFDPTPWLAYPQVILWGANHYASRLPDSPAWLVWDKRHGTSPDNHADVELAWTNLPSVARIHHQLWRGMLRAGEANVGWRGKWHPARKTPGTHAVVRGENHGDGP